MEQNFGQGDASYNAVGKLDGLIKLVDQFYYYMDTLPEAKVIRDMHPDDLTLAKEKLAYFLSGWLGGPRIYQEKFGSIRIPMAHRSFPIGYDERDSWMICMKLALDDQDYSEEFKDYLLQQLFRPAERIRSVCSMK